MSTNNYPNTDHSELVISRTKNGPNWKLIIGGSLGCIILLSCLCIGSVIGFGIYAYNEAEVGVSAPPEGFVKEKYKDIDIYIDEDWQIDSTTSNSFDVYNVPVGDYEVGDEFTAIQIVEDRDADEEKIDAITFGNCEGVIDLENVDSLNEIDFDSITSGRVNGLNACINEGTIEDGANPNLDAKFYGVTVVVGNDVYQAVTFHFGENKDSNYQPYEDMKIALKTIRQN